MEFLDCLEREEKRYGHDSRVTNDNETKLTLFRVLLDKEEHLVTLDKPEYQ